MEILPFKYENENVRAFQDLHGNAWFVAKDIAKLLRYKRPSDAISQHCKSYLTQDAFKELHGEIPYSLDSRLKLIPESDLWRLIIKSEMREAQEIEKWIMEEVLPSIRKTGSYTHSELPLESKPKEFNLEKLRSDIAVIKEVLELKPFEMLLLHRVDPINSPVSKMGIDLSGVYLLPTELGKLIGKTAIETNIVLEKLGYQIRIDGIWQLTEKGKPFGIELHRKLVPNGKRYHQIKWRFDSIKLELKHSSCKITL
jgi:prophage antirepressor-like protein